MARLQDLSIMELELEVNSRGTHCVHWRSLGVARDGPSGGGGGGLVNQPRTRVSGPVARPLRLASDRVIHSS